MDSCIERRIPMAIVTRNSCQSSKVKIERNAIPIDRVITRENSKPKPDPTALLELARDFALPTHEVLMVGDYRYDLEAGRNANMKSCLVNYTRLPDYSHLADYAFPDFQSLHEAMFGSR